MLRAGDAPRIWSVTEAAGLVQGILHDTVGPLWVAGEISNWRRVASGHCYFTLKDKQSQLRAVMWNRTAQVLPFRPDDGMQVLVHGRPTVYAVRGDLQLQVEQMEPRGAGALQLAFEQLKTKLEAEGLFLPARKRPLPRFPRRIGIVTAMQGAAVHDMRTVLRKRWPAASVVIRAVRVQGAGAGREIAEGIADLNGLGDVDVMIVGRGGGSLEDLWAFNEEVVARAIAASSVPVVSGVGHEVDFTIADFVADVRAPTPTAAAALVVPDRAEVRAAVERASLGLGRGLARRVTLAWERIGELERRLGDPQRRVAALVQRVDELGERARRGLRRKVDWEARELRALAARLARTGPAAQVARAAERLRTLGERLRFAAGVRVRHDRAALAKLAGQLDVLSPLACLARGYAIVRRDDPRGSVVTDAGTLAPGEPLTLVFAKGRARARVDSTDPTGEA
jgi:exodeoxyribonuclease VII large subunit